MTSSRELMSADLPNFPAEILDLWLGPFADTEGWPPCPDPDAVPTNRWRYLLGRRPLRFWQSVTWKKQRIDFGRAAFTVGAAANIRGLVGAYVAGETNLYSVEIGEGGKKRFWRIVEFLISNGTLPSPPPPVLLLVDGAFDILDGNHRIAAYLALGVMRRQEGFAAKLKQAAPLSEGVEVWVGEAPQQNEKGAD